MCEIGGTVGDIEGLPFFAAIRQLSNDLNLVNVESDNIPLLNSNPNIMGYPTIRKYSNNVGIDYNGDRSLKSLMKFEICLELLGICVS